MQVQHEIGLVGPRHRKPIGKRDGLATGRPNAESAREKSSRRRDGDEALTGRLFITAAGFAFRVDCEHRMVHDPRIAGMELDRLELVSGGRMGGIPHTANTREYLTCISGLIEVAVSGETFSLAAGDVLAFPGDEPHSYFNPGRAAASCVSVVVIAHGI